MYKMDPMRPDIVSQSVNVSATASFLPNDPAEDSKHLAYGIDVIGIGGCGGKHTATMGIDGTCSADGALQEDGGDLHHSYISEQRSASSALGFGIENTLTMVSCSFYDNYIHVWDAVFS